MHPRSTRRYRRSLLATLPSAILASAAALAQVVVTPPTPQTGTSQPAPIEPSIVKPTTKPCSVTLLSEQAFANYDLKPLSFTPPSGCAGPWAKVVFSADFTVTAGRQFDRTAKFFLGGANIYFGTTSEPRATLSPSWHVERDITDLSALFNTAQTGQANLGNTVDTTYTGIIYANARIDFYPANATNPAPAVPNAVLAFPANDTFRVSTTTDQSVGTFTFPRNLERVYLDVISQSQSTDEQWFNCVPSALSSELEECGNTAFRETEVAIDGKPAGVAPVYPWIYTGGIDPYLWEPIPGVETLNLKPYRVDLTPFAGLLADGKPHSVAVSVFNADSGFDVASTLLLYTDPGASTTQGALLTDTLSVAPSPQIKTSLNKAADGTVSGPVNVRSQRSWTIAGYVNTSHGRVDTTVQASNAFTNLQDLKVLGNAFKQNVNQNSEQHELTTTRSNTGVIQTRHDISFPLYINYNQVPNPAGNNVVTTYVKQQKIDELRSPFGPNSPDPVVSKQSIETTDVLTFNSNFSAVLSHSGSSANASYGAKDGHDNCIARILASTGVVLTRAEDSTSCSLVP